MYEENYGTSEEKYFVQFVRHAMDELKKKYTDIYLLRNERIFKIYRFSDGKAVEPDFVLFLTDKDTKKALSFQLFVEPKGQHLIKTDQWKEDFLKEIESHFKIVDLFESDKYRLVGLPFYNETLKKQEFKDAFERFVISRGSGKEKSDLFFNDVIPEATLSQGYLPVYDLQAVATSFREQRTPAVKGWKPMNKKFKDWYFIAQVVGKSMEPTIKDGSWCVFRPDQGGSRNGKIVLIESLRVADPETQLSFTIKRYKSDKKYFKDETWTHVKITLSPDNKDFKDIVLKNVRDDEFHIAAEFVEVLF